MLSTSSHPWSVNTRTVVLAAVFGAMVVALQVVGIGSIPVPNLSGAMTTLLIPVILGAIIGGPLVGLFAGLIMGVLYLILPATAAFGPITLIVPRLVFALVAWAVFRALKRAEGDTTNTVVASAAAGAAGALTNTVTAVGIAILLGQVPASIIPAILPQALIELVGCAVLIPIVVAAVESALRARAA